MKLSTLIKDWSETEKLLEDHSNSDYVPDNKFELAILCSGHYTHAELKEKLAQLEEANRVYRNFKE